MFNPINKIYLGSATPADNSGGGVDPEPAITDYNNLLNKPSINNVSLTGNKTLDELGIQEKGEYLVEDDLTDINANIDNINEDITKIKSDIENSSQVISTNTQSISNNTQSIANLTDELGNKAEKANTLAGYGITNAYTKTEVDAKVSSVYKVKGSVASYDNLPTNNRVVGDVYNIIDTGANYVWTGTEWDKLSETVDLSGYYDKSDIDTLLNNKQNKLTAGTNISIDSNNTIKCDIVVMEGATSTAMGVGGLVPTPRSGENTKYLRGDGVWYTPTNTTYSNFRGATTTTGGVAGLVPAPSGGYTERYLKGDGTWGIFPEIKEYTGGTNIEVEDDGTISFTGNDFTTAEKTKLSGIATGAQVNKIETIAVNGTNQTITNKRVNITVPTTTSQLTNNSGYITSTQANKSYVSKTGYYPYSQEADEALSKVSRWSDYNTTVLSLAAANLFETPIDTNANNPISDTLGRLLRITKAGNIGFFEMDLRYIGNISANNRVPVAEIPSGMRPLHKYTRIPAKIIVESNISVDVPLAVYIEINKEDSIIYLYNNLAFYANQYLGPRIMCSGSYVLGSMTI